MKNTPIVLILFTVYVMSFTSCLKDMTTPVYFQIDSVDFSTDYTTYGTASHKITDVWVTVNGVSVGVYELPAKFPVLTSGKVKLQFSPGIMMDGISSRRPSYPMYTSHFETVDLEIDTIYSFRPSFTYASYVNFAFKEDFEDAGLKFTAIEGSPPLEKTGDPKDVFQHKGEVNNYSGKISVLDTGSSFFEIITNDAYALKNTNTQYCFIELNYKMDIPESDDINVEVGLYVNTTTGQTVQCPLIKIKKSSIWKKMYINVTETMHEQSTYMKDFTVYIKGTTQTGVTASCFFDNIKLVYTPL